MAKKRTKIIYLTLTLLMMGVIFWFSAQDGSESEAWSGPIADFVFGILRVFDSSLTNEGCTYIVRKAAHFNEYALLAFLILQTVRSFSAQGNLLPKAVGSFCVAAAYAVSDEIHQYFVPGRACQVKDMLIDSSGALFGVLLTVLVIRFCGKDKNKQDGK